MTDVLKFLDAHPVEFWKVDDYIHLAVTHPTFFILLVLIILDIVTGLSATVIKKNGLDSSIAFQGWVKHTLILFSCFLLDFTFTAIGISMLGSIITILAYTIYIPSIIGNLNASGIKLPDYVLELFKREINRKIQKYLDEDNIKDEIFKDKE